MLLLVLGVMYVLIAPQSQSIQSAPSPSRREVIFWHLWGGKHRSVVEGIVERFNASQDRHFVRAVHMPGNNLDMKFFLAVAGGDPPDLLNQDDPVVADWAHRGVLTPVEELASPAEMQQLPQWLFPAARELGSYDGRLYALCNGLDIRALYYNRRILDQYGLEPPETLEQLDRIARTISPPGGPDEPRQRFGYLPDPRRLWAWGIVFGGRFYDEQTGRVTANDPHIVRALEWMTQYRQWYGAEPVTAFRTGDQALTGASFPLLQGRYAVLMDGQWRVAEMAEARQLAIQRGDPPPEYGVVPLPPPEGGLHNAGWVNGNFFVVPRGAKNPAGAWEFMKFWSGLGGHEAQAAQASAEGGWIPASQQVVDQPAFQEYLQTYPEFAQFVQLAGSPHQVPVPSIPAAGFYYEEVVTAAKTALSRDDAPPAEEILQDVTRRVQQRLEEVRGEAR